MANKGNKPGTAGKGPTLEECLKYNWTDAEVKTLSIQKRQPNSCLIRTDREDEVKCILKNIAKIRKWQKAANEDETASMKEKITELEQANKHLTAKNASAASQDDRVSLQRKITELEQANKDLSVKNESAASQDEVGSLQRKITGLEKANKDLTIQNEKLQQEIIKDQNNKKDLPHHQQTTTPSSSPEKPAENLPDHSTMLNEVEIELEKLRGEISKVESVKVDMEKQLQEVRSELNTVQEEKEKYESKWKEQLLSLETMQSQNENLKEQLSEAKRQPKEADEKWENKEKEKDKVTAENYMKSAQPSLLQKDARELNSQSPCGVDGIKISDVNQELDRANAEVQRLEQDFKKISGENEQLKEQLAKMKDDNNKLPEALQRKKEAEEKLKVEIVKGKALNEELEQARNEVSNLARQNELDQENIASLKNKIDEMKQEHKLAENKEKQELSNAKREIEKLQNLNKNLQAQIDARNAGKEMEHLKRQVKDLTDRLATEMNSKISGDESALENISISNRPMKLADDYQHFCSHVWLDAKEALDNGEFEQKNAMILLQKVLLVSEEKCSRAAKNVNRILLQLLNEPLKGEYSAKEENGLTQPIPDSARALFNGVGDYLRRTADSTDVRSIIEDVTVAHMSNNLMQTACKTYVEEAVRLSWKMVIQRPPMTFSVEGENKKWEGEQTQELYWGSHPDSKNAVVKYYVHPKLKHGDKLMVKGRVLVE